LATFEARILKKIFYAEDSGFGIFRVIAKGDFKGNQIITGTFFDVKEGDFIKADGESVTHPRFGKQIKVLNHESILPNDEEGIIRYLSSGRIKGVGKKTAKKIVDEFGLDTFDVLEKQSEKLSEVKGIRKGVIEEIKNSYNENKVIRELTVKLSPYGVGNETIFKIFKEFEGDALGILAINPYILIERIRGIGFKVADTIARGFGISGNDPNRLMAGIRFILREVEQKNGDLFTEESDLLNRAMNLLDVSNQDLEICLEGMKSRNELRGEDIPEPVVLTYKNFIIEKMIAKYLLGLMKGSIEPDETILNFDYLQERTSVELTEEQKSAITSALHNRITIITGGPGTGKTTIIRAIIESFLKDGKNVMVAAPTGRAAKRIEEATFFQASTIHRLLKVDAETKQFLHDEHNPLPADAVIIDEFSMVDSFLFYSLLRAISENTKLIIIGDKDQLPSVGPGNVLRDIILSEFFNTIYLHRNFRQNEDSMIIENAYRINNGEALVFKPYSEDLDFVFIRVTHEAQALEKALRILEYYKNEFEFNSANIQILAPMYRGDCGIDQLNTIIQDTYNPEQLALKKERSIFKRGDKVMQLKNNYDKEIFNGEQGIVAGIDFETKVLKVNFSGYLVDYYEDEFDQLTLSYGISVHKSQGSEYEMLILILLPAHAIMLNRELFYTAVTRAKKKIFLISDEVTIQRAISNSTPRRRKTLLPLRLEQAFTGSCE